MCCVALTRRSFMPSKKVATVNTDQCVACGSCENVCPRQTITVYKGCYAMVDTQRCVGCGTCAKVCPVCCITIEERGSL